MSDKSLAGKCGLYCGACSIYRAERDGVEYRMKLAEHFRTDPQKVQCNGCGELLPDSWGFNLSLIHISEPTRPY